MTSNIYNSTKTIKVKNFVSELKYWTKINTFYEENL